MAIITTGRLIEKQTPESSSLQVDALLTKVAYRDTSYFGAAASGLKLEHDSISGDFVFWTVSNPDDKVRSNLRVGIGDIFTGFAAAEISATETFFDKKIQPSEIVEFRDVFNRKLLSFQQRNVQTSDDLRNYSYQSILTKLNNTYPASFAKRAQDLPGGLTQLTAKGWLELLFAEWANTYPWFQFEPLPELYPRGFTTEITAPVFTVFQEEDSERSMRSILDDILALFEGYRLVVTSENKLRIQAPLWSPAYSSGQATLANVDLYTYPISLPQDYSNIANKVTVKSTKYDFVAEQIIVEPSFVPTDWNGDTLTGNDNSANYPEETERKQCSSSVPLAEDTLIDESEIKVTLQCEVYENQAYKQTRTEEVTLAKNVPKRVNIQFNYVLIGDPNAVYELTFDGKAINVKFLFNSSYEYRGSISGPNNFAWMSYILLIDATGKKWQPSGVTESATFGVQDEDEAELNGLATSQANFGVLEYTVQNTYFSLDLEQLEDIAKATVDALMRPTTRFNLELSAWNQFAGLTPEQIGKKIILPSGLEGVLSDFSYSDDYEGDTPIVNCVAEITVIEELD